MGNLLRLTCTIPKEDFDEDNLFLMSYFPVLVADRQGQYRKYYSLVTRESYPTIIEALEKELNNIGITNYAFNISTDYNLKSIKK